jgi:hypothetical protein
VSHVIRVSGVVVDHRGQVASNHNRHYQILRGVNTDGRHSKCCTDATAVCRMTREFGLMFVLASVGRCRGAQHAPGKLSANMNCRHIRRAGQQSSHQGQAWRGRVAVAAAGMGRLFSLSQQRCPSQSGAPQSRRLFTSQTNATLQAPAISYWHLLPFVAHS